MKDSDILIHILDHSRIKSFFLVLGIWARRETTLSEISGKTKVSFGL